MKISVRNNKINYKNLYLVLALVGNKYDLFDREEISEDEGRILANEMGAIFSLTSAKENFGIDDLFSSIGNKFLNINLDKSVEVKEKKPIDDKGEIESEKKIFKKIMKYLDF